MINILHLQTELNLTCGITRNISLLIRNIKNEFDNYLITLGGDTANAFSSLPVHLRVLQCNRYSLWGSFKIFFAIFKYCKKNRIQIIHSHHRYFDFIAYIISKILDVKTITSVQSKVYKFKKVSYNADLIIAASNSVKSHLISYFEIPEAKIQVINNFIDPGSIQIANLHCGKIKELNIFGKFIIGFIGRFSIKEKGVDILLNAFSKISEGNQNIILLMVGNGEDEDYIQKYAVKLSGKIIVLPPQSNIYDFYSICNLIVLPSRVDPFPLTMLETGFMKIPFVGSRVDGIAEFIEHGLDGLLFESGNCNALIKHINEIIIHKEKAEMFAANLHHKVMNNYTAEKIIPEYIKLYNQLLNECK